MLNTADIKNERITYRVVLQMTNSYAEKLSPTLFAIIVVSV